MAFSSARLLQLLHLALLSAPSLGVTVLGPVTELHLTNKVIAPDGFERSSIVVDGTFPGPIIAANKGDKFSVNLHVQDQLTDNTMLRSTSIHWHGILQHNTSWEDGPSFVAQCPIAANHSFLYEFQAGDAATGQAGTFWYHSHLSTQYCDGLRGPLIIYDPHDPLKHLYDIDDASTVLSVGDWYHYPAPSAPALALANSTLINGLGRYQGGPASPLAVITVTKGKRYRFRLISMSCDPSHVWRQDIFIDGHEMTVIEADGVSHAPTTVDSFEIFAGQRYSFVLHANQKVGNYWVRGNPSIGILGFEGGINSAILRYVGAPDAEPTTNDTSSNPLKETDLHSLTGTPVPGQPFPGGADVNINLQMSLDFATGQFEVNGAPFVNPTAPVLLQILSGAQTAQDLLPPGTVYGLPPNKVIEISLPGGSPGAPHPFHLHGHNFWVVRSAGNSTYNYFDPVRRDVLNTGPALTDNVTIRFVTDNAGPWFFHCHNIWHLEVGLAVVFAEDIPTIQGEQKNGQVPQNWDELCPIYDSLTADQL
ncbi:laccase 1 [Roridomyces roridus]|uniref:Laccase 1 n=1 Tax=Roridomyces roridus TaxID=1738132 RepID=A0AAD7C8Z9_9AGAR|nr:laccase 1 [Roridomyces roridus]